MPGFRSTVGLTWRVEANSSTLIFTVTLGWKCGGAFRTRRGWEVNCKARTPTRPHAFNSVYTASLSPWCDSNAARPSQGVRGVALGWKCREWQRKERKESSREKPDETDPHASTHTNHRKVGITVGLSAQQSYTLLLSMSQSENNLTATLWARQGLELSVGSFSSSLNADICNTKIQILMYSFKMRT